MAHGDYYNPANKSVTDGTVVYADDVNKINTAVDSAFEQVAYDLDVIEADLEAGGLSAKNWATEDQGTRPDPILDLYSAKAYALEAKGWASAAGTITEASTGAALAGSASAKTKAAEAAASALAASGSASSASGSAGIATTKAGEALGSANAAAISETNAGNSAIAAAASAANLPNATTAGANKLLTTNSSGNGWEYPSITAAGKAILDDASATAQRITLGLGNVANVDTTNASNITSGTLSDARIPSTIARDSELAAHTGRTDNPHSVTPVQLGLGRKNLLINGGFDVWQRGTSFTAAGEYYTADRWVFYASHTSMQAVARNGFSVEDLEQGGVTRYYARIAYTLGSGLEDVFYSALVENGVKLTSGKTVTASFIGREVAGKDVYVQYVQHFGTGGSPSAEVMGGEVVSLGTDFERNSVTFDVPSVVGKTFGSNNDSYLELRFIFTESSNTLIPRQAGTFDIGEVQLEFGDTATDFEYRHPAEELALCKYYFERVDNTSSVGSGYQYSNGVVANARGLSLSFTPKRTVPTVTYTGYQVLLCTYANVLANTQFLEVRVNTTGAGSYRIWDGVFDIDAEI